MPQSIIKSGEEKMEKAIEALKKELSGIRTSRANPAVLNGINVSYYGSLTPINHLAAITVPEPQLLVITPYDKSILKDIEKAIQLADLNLVPQNDGSVIRINFPALTMEKRKEFTKSVKTINENSKIAVRNIRRDMVDAMKKLEKNSEISEDELKRQTENIQKITDKYIEKVDTVAKEKEKAIMEL